MSRSLSSNSLTSGKKVRLQRKFYEKLDDFTARVLLHSESGYVVYRAKCRYSMGIVVLKGYGRDILTKPNKLRIVKEVEVLQQNECPFLLRCFDCFEDQGWWWLVLENCAGGDLYGISQTHPEAASNEGWLASQVVLPMLQTLAYLHEEGLMHRDIKPEHILFNSEKVAKLGGFFLCHDLAEQGLPMDLVGEMQYSAPEMIISGQQAANNKRYCYDHKVDVWSLGMLIYECLVGQLPFQDDDPKIMADMILTTDPDLPPYLTEDARDFLMQALQKDPEDRSESSALLDHPWITSNLDWIPEVDFEDPVILSSYYSGMEDNEPSQKKWWSLGSTFGSLFQWRKNKDPDDEPTTSRGLLGWLPSLSCKDQSPQHMVDSKATKQEHDLGNNPMTAEQFAKSSFKKSFNGLHLQDDDGVEQDSVDMIGSHMAQDSPHMEDTTFRHMYPTESSKNRMVPHGHLLPLEPLQSPNHYDSPRHLPHPMQPDIISPRISNATEMELAAMSSRGGGPPSLTHSINSSPRTSLMVPDLGNPLRRPSTSMLSSQWQRAPTEPLAAMMQQSGRPNNLPALQESAGEHLGDFHQHVFPDPTMPYPGSHDAVSPKARPPLHNILEQ